MFPSRLYLSRTSQHSLITAAARPQLYLARTRRPPPVNINTLSTQFEGMFSRAVHSHKSSQPATSSSPPNVLKSTTQKSLPDAFTSKASIHSLSTKKTGILKPTQSNLNASSSSRLQEPTPSSSSGSASRKRSFSQQSKLASVCDTDISFEDDIVPPLEAMGQPPPMDPMAALHEAVYFAEDDFDSDCDLDFEYSLPTITQRPSDSARTELSPVKKGQQSKLSPKHKKPQWQEEDLYEDLDFPAQIPMNSVDHMKPPPSSAPLPWSSSPAEHMQPLSALKRPAPKEGQMMNPPDAKKTRRTLPWTSEAQPEKEVPKEPTSRTTRSASEVTSKKLADTTMPWNTSFEKIEAEKKEARKRNSAKRLVQTEDPQETKKVIKFKGRVPKIFLSEEQKNVVDLVTNNKQSVFFTGSAGTGKSVLLRELIAVLKRKHKKDTDAVAVTASTGLAACNIGGVTLHSFAGIGLGKEPVVDLVRRIKRNPKAKLRWLKTKILIIDEISMVDGDMFDKLEAIARQVRNNGQAFGGIQLVITGDFFQLPPVPEGGKMAKFAFDANTWRTCIGHTIGLTQVFRQRDPEFADMLNEMRLGRLTPKTVTTFQSLSRPLQYNDGIQATELFSTRSEVDSSNNQMMRQLPGEAMRFCAVDSGSIKDVNIRTKLLSSCMAPAEINLKINSQVMLIKNVDDSLVNGSLGRVVGFMSEKMFDLQNDDVSERKEGKSSGADTAKRWPLVQFALIDGTSRQLLCQPELWKVELPNGEVQAQRSQIPLILAWALSIHKAQGQTLERVKVNLGKVFEKGQAYVALSRATCKEGLQVLGFDARKVMAHDRVRGFYASLYSAAEATNRSTVLAAKNQVKAPARKSATKEIEYEDYADHDEQEAMGGMY